MLELEGGCLRPAANALLIDTTEIGIEAVVDTIVGAAKKDVT
jgi:cytidylate kinase